MTDIVSSDRPLAVVDVEVYANYFLFKAKRVDNGKVAEVEMYEGHPLDIDRIKAILSRYEIVTFNGRNFDVPVIYAALKGFSCEKLKLVCDSIIQGNMKPWDIEREFKFKIPRDLKHIDLIEVAPGQASLKIYGGRIHCRKMQDLPIEPDALITPEQRVELAIYCGNDLEVTEGLLRKLTPQLELRRALSIEYGDDYMSKSDAQIAEAVLKLKIEEITGDRPVRPTFPTGTKFKYQVPDYIKYSTPELNAVLDAVRASDFVVSPSGGVEMPEALSQKGVRIGGSIYRMGIGGLHSSEESICHFATEDEILKDVDATSFYPSIILGQGLFPKHLGPEFLTVYRTIVERRVSAKHKAAELQKVLGDLKKQLASIEK